MGQDGAPLTALLGPTNTGKTHRAVERMLEHDSGMIGFPLRLLAREVYDRLTARLGERRVALVTGEEKRVPKTARYWISTVEAMPVDRDVDFLAVDEIQLCAHRQRGHVFTDRLLRARGREETMFLGSHSMAALIEELLPAVQVQSHPRLSKLSGAGHLSLSQLPPRTAVVAFSTSQVYETAERLRRRFGGAAVVTGALSPQTRNAQVALYQSGEVDYLVATDAIGMGLNLDVDLVLFAGLKKFDGKDKRHLDVSELSQIAGRAGRYLNDGRFGTLSPQRPLPRDVVEDIEHHRLDPVTMAVWRNADLDLSSIDALLDSLRARPRRPQLRLVESADDSAALAHLAKDPEVRALVGDRDAVQLLWEVCQVPDFGGIMVEHHARLLRDVFLQLMGARNTLDPAWVDEAVGRIDETTGDIDRLMMRIELIRTWTYISHRDRWLRDPGELQERTRAIEDRLSAALHDRLVERFVDRRAKGPARQAPRPSRKRARLAPAAPEVPVDPSNPFAALMKLRATLAPATPAPTAVDQDQVARIVEAAHHDLELERDGQVAFEGHVVGRLTRGNDVAHPGVQAGDGLPAGAQLRVRRRLQAYARDVVDELLGPLRELRPESSSPLRGLVYQLELGLSSIATRDARVLMKALEPADRQAMAKAGVRLGRHHWFLDGGLRPDAMAARITLTAVHLGRALTGVRVNVPSQPVIGDLTPPQHRWLGLAVVGPRAVRLDVLERVDARLQEAAKAEPFLLPREVESWLGCPRRQLTDVLAALGYHRQGEAFTSKRRPRSTGRGERHHADRSASSRGRRGRRGAREP